MQSQEIEQHKKQELSIQDKPVSRAVSMSRHMLKFFEYNMEMFEQTQHRLLAITYNLGITEPPNAPQLQLLVEFLKNNFAESNMEEVAYAAELYCIGNLEDCPKHYNQMTMEFLGKMMRSYRIYRANELKRVEAIERKQRLADEEYERRRSLPPSEEDLHRMWLEAEKKSWDDICDTVKKTKSIPLAWRWEEVYQYLKASGQITETNEQLAEMKTKWEGEFKKHIALQKADITKTSRGSGLQAALQELNKELSNPQSLKEFCRKQYVIQKFQTIIDEKK